MRVAIYSPYLDTLGGGERYMLTIAELLSKKHQVDILLDSHLYLLHTERLIKKSEDRFGLDLSRINLVKAPLGKDSNLVERSIFLTKYDLLFALTDGSIFYPTSTINVLHIQSPIAPSTGFGHRIKLSGWDLLIYNSEFTMKHSQKRWNKKSQVIYPPVDIQNIKVLSKKNYILSVGRFFGYLRDKKHSLIIESFKKLSKKNKDWTLLLVGSAGEGDQPYIGELTKLSSGYPVKILPNLEFEKLMKLYGEAKIYWHAAGFGEDDPSKMEHFGISTVEAMAGGCVPIVVNKGGQKEIVENGQNGFLWSTQSELVELTQKVIDDGELMAKLSSKAILKAASFSKEVFCKHIEEMIEKLF